MSYVPPPDQVDRGARALGKARGLVWESMNKDWQTEHRRQVIAILIAAHGEAPARVVMICPQCHGERRIGGHLCPRCRGTAQITIDGGLAPERPE